MRPASCSLAAPSAENISTWSKLCCSVVASTAAALLTLCVRGCSCRAVQTRRAAAATQATVRPALRPGLRNCARTSLEMVAPSARGIGH